MVAGHKVTVLGAGNAGHTFAWRMASRGTEVMIWEHPDFSHNLDGIRENNGIVEAVETFRKGEITIHTDFHGKARIAHTTTDIEEAMKFSDIIIMSVPAFAHESMFKLIMPHLHDRHLLNVFPGNYCSLIFTRMLREANLKRDLTVMEGASIPFACRVVAPGRIFVGGIKDKLEVGVFPARKTGEVKHRMTGPNFKLLFTENIIATGLGNGNIVVHPATAVLNMGAFESPRVSSTMTPLRVRLSAMSLKTSASAWWQCTIWAESQMCRRPLPTRLSTSPRSISFSKAVTAWPFPAR